MDVKNLSDCDEVPGEIVTKNLNTMKEGVGDVLALHVALRARGRLD